VGFSASGDGSERREREENDPRGETWVNWENARVRLERREEEGL